jgi:hypothetical protein
MLFAVKAMTNERHIASKLVSTSTFMMMLIASVGAYSEEDQRPDDQALFERGISQLAQLEVQFGSQNQYRQEIMKQEYNDKYKALF